MNTTTDQIEMEGGMIERLLRVKEVSAITGEDCQTVYTRIRKGEIKGTKLGRRNIRVSESALREWLNLPGQARAETSR